MIRSDACHDGHDQGGGDAFSRHVGQRDADLAIAQLDEIIVVAADAAGRNADRGEIGTVGARRSIGQQAALDVRRLKPQRNSYSQGRSPQLQTERGANLNAQPQVGTDAVQ